MSTGPKQWHSAAAFKNTIGDLKSHPGTILGAGAVISLPLFFAAVYNALRPNFLGTFLTLAGTFFASIWLGYAITIATKMFAEGGNPGPGELIGLSASSRMFTYLGSQILIGLLVIAAFLVAAIPLIGVGFAAFPGMGAGFDPGRFGPLAVVFGLAVAAGVLIALLLGLFIYLRFGLGPTATAMEGVGAGASLKRSRLLTEGNRMDFFLLILMALAAGFVVSILLSGPGLVVSLGQLPSDGSAPGGGLFGSGPFAPEPEPLSAGAALISGLSAYLATMASGILNAGLLANFYLALRGEEASAQSRAAGVDLEAGQI